MTSVVSDRGQTIVPKAIREALGITAGTVLTWEAGAQELRVSKAKLARKGSGPLRAFYASVRGQTDWEPGKMPAEATREIVL